MREKLMEIFTTFGQASQIEKLREEVAEFIEAVEADDDAAMHEEYADVMVVLVQFAHRYDLDEGIIEEAMVKKIKRTLNRIDQGYYTIH